MDHTGSLTDLAPKLLPETCRLCGQCLPLTTGLVFWDMDGTTSPLISEDGVDGGKGKTLHIDAAAAHPRHR